MKKITYLLLMIAGATLFSCNSSDKSNGRDDEQYIKDLAKADTIPFFTTLKKMVEAKDIISKEFGADIKLTSLQFENDDAAPFSVHIINKQGDSMMTYYYTANKKFKNINRDYAFRPMIRIKLLRLMNSLLLLYLPF